MEPLLFLVHRIPYPPNKGDKIRSYNLLKFLAANYEVHLATFIDDPFDWKYVDAVNELCKSTLIRPQNKKLSTLKSLSGFITGKALSLTYYSDSKIEKWCQDIINTEHISKVVVFSSPMAQFSECLPDNIDQIIDFVDVDSDKWRQYSQSKSWPMNQVYRREANKLREYECHIAKLFKKSFFVSSSESDLSKSFCPEAANKISFFDNGVDYEYFSCDENSKNPYETANAIVFTGAMDYWANADAVIWFAEKVFPLIRKEISDAVFYIVGSNPANKVKALSNNSGVIVTGRVDDIRRYVQYASVCVAPMRIARGVQNKVIEALSLARPVVATGQAMEGLKPFDSPDIVQVADSENEFSGKCIEILKRGHWVVNDEARAYVIKNYSWMANLKVIGDELQ